MLFSENDIYGMLEAFAEPCIAFKDTSDEFNFDAIFKHPQADFDIDGASFKYSGSKATLTCRTKDTANFTQGEKNGSVIFAREKNWRVSNIRVNDTNYHLTYVDLKKV